MAGDEVFVDARIALLIAAETLICDFVAPDADLRGKVAVDFLNDIRVFNNELERDHIAGRMNTFISSCATDKR